MKKSILMGISTVAFALGGTASVIAVGSSSSASPIETLAKADSGLLKTIRINITLPDWANLSDVKVENGTVTHVSGRNYTADITSTSQYGKIKMTFVEGGSVTWAPQDGDHYNWIDDSGFLPGWSYTLTATGWAWDDPDDSGKKYYNYTVTRDGALTQTRVYFEKYNWSDAAVHGYQRVKKSWDSSQTDDRVFTDSWGSDASLPEISDVTLDGKSVLVADVPYMASGDEATTYYIYYDNSDSNKSQEFTPIEGAYYSFGDAGAMIADADKGKALDLIMKIKDAMGTASTIYGSRDNSICKILDDPSEILADYAALGSAKTVFDNATINTYIEGVNKDYSTKGAVKFGDIIEFITEKTSAAGLVSIVGHGANSTLMIATITAVGLAAAGTMVFFARKRKDI